MRPRPVHYVSQGFTTRFSCYQKEMMAHLDSPIKTVTTLDWTDSEGNQHRSAKQRHTILVPVRSTDLRKVTCTFCWVQIQIMARNRVGG